MSTSKDDATPTDIPDAASKKLIHLPLPGQSLFHGSLSRWITPPVEKLLSVDKINTVYTALAQSGGHADFFDRALALLQVDYRVSETDLAKIPETGPLIIIANHPFGGIEGIILGRIAAGIRKDVKILGNQLLQQIPELRERIIPVDVFEGHGSVPANASAYRQAVRWLRKGGALITFPAGEVSHLNLRRRCVEDRPWPPHIGSLVRMTRARVLPVFIPGRNSALFNLLGLVNPMLRTAMLPRELVRKGAADVPILIGRPIIWQRLNRFDSDEAITRYLRFHTYFLENRAPELQRPPAVHRRPKARTADFSPVIPPVPSADLQRELAALPPDQLLATQKSFSVYVARAAQIPALMREIARQREISFRDVDEGTGKPLDTDAFDEWYLQLFLWDRRAGAVAGAYRLGLTDEILRDKGLRGLYTHSLFRIQPQFLGQMGTAVELGRSFIQPEYRRRHGCLALLWRGIGEFIARNCRYRTLFGPVSISRDYHRVSRNLMVEFLRSTTADQRFLRLVSPRHPYRTTGRRKAPSPEALRSGDLEHISMLVSEIESDGKGVPTLIKHYLKLNGKFISFNVDRHFSDVVDGLVVVDLTQTEARILRRFMGDAGHDAFAAHHAGGGEADVA